MIHRSLAAIGWCVVGSFALVGVITCLVAFRQYSNSYRVAPHYSGQIYDCRQPNGQACFALLQLAGQQSYAPEVCVYQYPEDKVTMISVDSASQTVHFLFPETVITVQAINGKAPQPTDAGTRLAKR